MWYFILLLFSSLVGCANRYSEDGAGVTVAEFVEPRGKWPEKSLGITDVKESTVPVPKRHSMTEWEKEKQNSTHS
jgi:hypothetical protein